MCSTDDLNNMLTNEWFNHPTPQSMAKICQNIWPYSKLIFLISSTYLLYFIWGLTPLEETGRIFLRGEPPFRETCDMWLWLKSLDQDKNWESFCGVFFCSFFFFENQYLEKSLRFVFGDFVFQFGRSLRFVDKIISQQLWHSRLVARNSKVMSRCTWCCAHQPRSVDLAAWIFTQRKKKKKKKTETKKHW